MDFKKELEIMRANYAKKPLKSITLPVPSWLTHEDGLSALFRDKETLITEGKIYYAHIIQANELIFRTDNKFNCAACLVYSEDDIACEQPWVLNSMASQLFSYKDQDLETVPEEWREMARVITDEYERSSFDFTAHSGNGLSVNMHMRDVLVFRDHLPKKVLKSSLLPIFAAPEMCDSVLILPETYWSKAFRKAWAKGQL